MKLRVEVEIKPTEAQEKVEAAVKKIFPTLELQRVENFLIGESVELDSLSRFYQLIRLQAILDSARSAMLAERQGNIIKFMLNKQTAFVSRVNFTDVWSILGPITVTLEAPDIERLIDYLAPRTREGKPVCEISYTE